MMQSFARFIPGCDLMARISISAAEMRHGQPESIARGQETGTSLVVVLLRAGPLPPVHSARWPVSPAQ
eukprot:733296-Hanusia_phi.AAC.2